MVSTRSLLLSGGSPKTISAHTLSRFSLFSCLWNLGRQQECTCDSGEDLSLKLSWYNTLASKLHFYPHLYYQLQQFKTLTWVTQPHHLRKMSWKARVIPKWCTKEQLVPQTLKICLVSHLQKQLAFPVCSRGQFFCRCHLFMEKAVAAHSSALAWRIPGMGEPGGLQSMGSWRVRHDWVTSLSLFTFTHWRRKWQPTPVFLPGESQGWGSLVGCRLWRSKELDTTEAT